jgi:hypothetical protein
MFEVPILFLVFNRPDTTRRVFNKIKEVRPRQLFIAADGPRSTVEGEALKCLEVRDLILNQIDWNCEVKTLFRETNLGCGLAVSSAITWFFESVEEGIILEDDCLPNSDFFVYCEVLLEKYRYNNNIFTIGGTQINKQSHIKGYYYFTTYGLIWGWATWRRAWKKYKFDVNEYDDKDIQKTLKKYFKLRQQYDYWLRIYYSMKERKIDTWDYQWCLAQWFNNGYNIVSKVNLVSNIGFGKFATHTLDSTSSLSNMRTEDLFVDKNYNALETIQWNADSELFYYLFEEKQNAPKNTHEKPLKLLLLLTFKLLGISIKSFKRIFGIIIL